MMEATDILDPQLADALDGEARRQREGLNLIAAENYASPAVMRLQGSVFTNKYAEGYPGRRYYSGCRYVDEVENLARERLIALFDAEHANVQPHSGTQANMAVYFSVLDPGDRILGMSLDQGGHLSHGHPVNFSGRFYHVIHYGLDRESERIDYDQVEELAKRERPKLIIAGASAYPRFIDYRRFREICDEVGAYLLADAAHISGLIAGGEHPSPVPYADFVTSSTQKTMRGPRGGLILCKESLAAKIDRSVFPGTQGGPLMHVIAAKAAAFHEAQSEGFRRYQGQIVANAKALAAALEGRGYRLVSGGTDNHLMLVDLRERGLTGAQAEAALEAVGIMVNKNAIPFDPEKPTVTSGIRLGTPALTTRGMGPAEMEESAELIDEALGQVASGQLDGAASIRERVKGLATRFPLFQAE